MPAAVSLTDNASTVAFSVPAGALGFVMWNTSAAELRVRIGRVAAGSGGNEGIPLPAGNMTPQYLTHYFDAPLRKTVRVCIFQASGGDIANGVGYDVITL